MIDFLIVVEGPTEIKQGWPEKKPQSGVILRIVERVCGPEIAANSTVKYWKEALPVKRNGMKSKRLSGDAEKAVYYAKMALDTTKLGVVLVRDNDHCWLQSLSERECSIRAALTENGVEPEKFAVGVPIEMIESWLLADNVLFPHSFLPPGKTPELCWGDQADPHSNHPKRVLDRVLTQRCINLQQAVQDWSLDNAINHSVSLQEFVMQIEQMLAPELREFTQLSGEFRTRQRSS